MAILPVDPNAPFLVRAGADILLWSHIGGGSLGMVSGAVAVLAPKGERLHRIAGNVFFVSMLIMSGVGATVAPFLPDRISSLAGAATFYLVASAWATVMRREGTLGWFELGASSFATAVAVAGVFLGWLASQQPHGLLDHQSYQTAYMIAAIMTLAAALDLKVIFAGGISGRQRIARHLWRMCLGFGVATGSFFFGQAKMLPTFMVGSWAQMALGLAPFAFLLFWIVKVQFSGRQRRAAPALAVAQS